MSRKFRPTKSVQQIKDEQIALMVGEIENDMEKFKIALNDKDKQLIDLGKLLKAAINEYQKVVKENKQLREYIITNRKTEEYRQQHTVKKKKKNPQKYKKVVHELESDSETENIEEDTPEIEVKEIEEELKRKEKKTTVPTYD